MIIVTGANGQLGRAIVDKLLKHVPASRVGASVRDPGKAHALIESGVRVRRGDFDDKASLEHSFEGAKQVLIVSSNAAAYGGDPLAQHRTAITAARDAGADRIVYTSHMAASANSAFPPARDHYATEMMLRECGTAWTALRNGFYASAGVFQMGDSLKSGLLEVPADGKVSWTAHDDLAEAAATILSGKMRYEGATPPLTGSQSLDLADLAEIASDIIGRPIRRSTIADKELHTKMAARGLPDSATKFILAFYIASRNCEFAAVDSTLASMLGRAPISMREVLATQCLNCADLSSRKSA